MRTWLFYAFLIVLFAVDLYWFNTDSGRAVYCWGKIDAIDPWC